MSVTPRGNGWEVRWRIGGKNKSRSFNRADGFTREDAERFDHSMKRRKRMGGVDPLAAERPFEDVGVEWWRAHSPTLSHRTRVDQLSYLQKRIGPRFAGHRLCDITPPEVDAFRIEMIEDGTGDPTIRKVLYVLSGIFTYAQRMGFVQSNPVQPIEKPGTYRQRLIQPLPPERVEQIRNWFLARGDLAGATMVSVLAYAGPRPEEAHSILTWGDVGPQAIIFRAGKTKADRSTRLLAPLAADLKDWQKDTGVMVGQVFGWSGSKFNNWRRKRFHKATAAAGIDLTRPYDLRHAFATLLRAEGKRTDYIAEQLGHSRATGERWYSHMPDGDGSRQDAEERIWAARRHVSQHANKREAL